MKTVRRVITAVILFVLIIGGMQVLARNEKAAETSASAIDRVKERLEWVKEKEENVVAWMRAHYLLNSKADENSEQDTENDIHYSTESGADFSYDTDSSYTDIPYTYETGYIFLGDSRIYLMNQDCKIEQTANFFVVSCPGMGYDWMMSNGFPQIEQIKQSHPQIHNWVLISAFGLNDLDRIDSYVDTYSYLAQSMDIRLLSINPTMGVSDARYSNSNIEAFNKRLQEITGVSYIDCYSYLSRKGFWMIDNLHYNEQSNWDIYAFVLDYLNANAGGSAVTGSDSRDRALKLQQKLSRMS